MKRLRTLIILIINAIVGSFVNFYSVNLVMNAVMDKDSDHFIFSLLTPIPVLMISFMFVVLTFYVLRLYLHPTHQKKMMKIYGIVFASMAFVGLIFLILSGALVFHSFIKPYPFPGYHIILTIILVAIMVLGFLMIFFFPKKIQDPDIILSHLNWKRILITAIFSLIIFYAYNRFGAFLWSPTYILWRTFTDTYPFYLSLVLLIALLAHILLYTLNYYRAHSVAGIAISSALIVLSLFFFTQIVTRGVEDQEFISAISPAVPIERLLTFPYDIIINAAVVVGLGAFTLNNSIVFKRLKDSEDKKYNHK